MYGIKGMRGFGVWNPPNRADYGLDPGGGGMHCDPRDVACVLEQTAAGNAFDLAMSQAQAQNNLDTCMSNAENATSQAQYDATVARCQGQFAIQNAVDPSAALVSAIKNPLAAPPSAPLSGGQLTFTTSRGGTALQVGDTWMIAITNAMPNATVTVSGSGPSGAFDGTVMGQTDGNGNFSKSGSFDASTIGTWTELWRVGLLTSGSISFTVAAISSTPGKVPVINPPAAGTPAGGTPTGATPSGGFNLAESFNCADPTTCWGGFPKWAVIAAAAGAALFAFGGGRGR